MTATTAAASAGIHHTEAVLFFTLLQLIVIILAARLAGQIARHFGQPRAVGEILAGLALGPSLFGHLMPDVSNFVFHSTSSEPITIISQVGLLLLMFQIGIDFDFSHLRSPSNRRAVTMISALSILFPFTLGFFAGKLSAPYLMPNGNWLNYSLFVATAFSITAVPILGRIMMEFDLNRTEVGAITISAAAANDVVGWILLAVISALSVAQFTMIGTSLQLLALIAYLGVCWFLVKPFLHWLCRNFTVSQNALPQNLIAIMIALIFISGMCTYKIGIFAIFGGFVLGVIMHSESSFVSAWKRSVGDFVMVFFLPVFFTYTGLRTNVQGLDSIELWQWCSAMIAFATLGKFGGAYLGARSAGLSSQEAGTIGIMMNTRALMELIVLNIGLDLGVLPHEVFTMLVIMAIFSTVITAPVLRSLLPRIGHFVPQGIDA